jgi:DNA-binding response OmpR family regulator
MSKGKVLFIDDDSFLRKVYQAELHDKGFDVELAVDGEDGLRKIAELKPDCVILDLIMPKKSGFEVLTDLQRSDELRGIPVIILSNLAQSDDQKRALDLGAVEYLVKDNTTLDIIAEKIDYHMHMSQANRTKAPKGTAAAPVSKSAETDKTAPISVKQSSAAPQTTATIPSQVKRGSAHNFCPECGTKLDKGVKFCPQCGAQQF